MTLLLSMLLRRRPRATGPGSPDPSGAIDIAALYERYAGMVMRRCRRFFDTHEAEEVVHEVFLRALEKQDTFRGESSPSTWLYQLTTNHCLNRIRNRRRRQEARLVHGEHPWTPPSQPADAETSAFLKELWTRLDPALLEVGVYYFVDGLTHEEIARIMGVSRRTVGNRVAELQAQAERTAGRDGR